MTEPHLRAADADRTAVADVLGRHMAAGRLTVAEYDERLTRAYAATTYGELAELTADLPDDTPAPATVSRRAPEPVRWGAHGCHGADGGSRRSWAATAAIVIAVWATTSLANWEFLYFWPVWVIGPWGAVLLVQSLAGRGDGDDSGPGPRALPER